MTDARPWDKPEYQQLNSSALSAIKTCDSSKAFDQQLPSIVPNTAEIKPNEIPSDPSKNVEAVNNNIQQPYSSMNNFQNYNSPYGSSYSPYGFGSPFGGMSPYGLGQNGRMGFIDNLSYSIFNLCEIAKMVENNAGSLTSFYSISKNFTKMMYVNFLLFLKNSKQKLGEYTEAVLSKIHNNELRAKISNNLLYFMIICAGILAFRLSR